MRFPWFHRVSTTSRVNLERAEVTAPGPMSRYDHVLSEEFDDYERRTTCRSCRGPSADPTDVDERDGCDAPTPPCPEASPRFAYVALTLVAVLLLAVGLATFYGSRYQTANVECRWQKPVSSSSSSSSSSSGWPIRRPHCKCRSARRSKRPEGTFVAVLKSAVSFLAES